MSDMISRRSKSARQRWLRRGLGTVLLTALPIAADEGKIPIYSEVIIAGPGHYVLTRDIETDSGIRIMSDGVVLDLNGRSITVTDPLATAVNVAILDTVALDIGVTIRNGQLEGGRSGIELSHPGGGRLLIEKVRISNTRLDGIRVQTAAKVTIRDCRIHNVGSAGIFYQSLGDGRGGLIENNIVDGSGFFGYHLTGVGLQVRGNSAVDTGNHGFSIVGDGNRVVGNAARGAGTVDPADGIVLVGSGMLVERNVASHGVRDGFRVFGSSSGIVLRHNVASGNAVDGFHASGARLTVEDNVGSGNTRYGLYTGNDPSHGPVIYRGNVLLGNGSGSGGELNPGFLDDQGGNVCVGACP